MSDLEIQTVLTLSMQCEFLGRFLDSLRHLWLFTSCMHYTQVLPVRC